MLAERRNLGISPDSRCFSCREDCGSCDHGSLRSSPQLILPAVRPELAPICGRTTFMPEKPAAQDAVPVVGVIDPDPVARNGLRTLLRRLGVDVETFDSAESYLLAASGRHPACLIVDLLLPGMSGLELLRRLRSAGSDVPVVLLADESDVSTAVAAMREGATDFIEKPYVDVAVLKQVQKLLRRPPGATLA
jgi:CheY-like chemotaxis protein